MATSDAQPFGALLNQVQVTPAQASAIFHTWAANFRDSDAALAAQFTDAASRIVYGQQQPSGEAWDEETRTTRRQQYATESDRAHAGSAETPRLQPAPRGQDEQPPQTRETQYSQPAQQHASTQPPEPPEQTRGSSGSSSRSSESKPHEDSSHSSPDKTSSRHQE